jgi:hypothetical protein
MKHRISVAAIVAAVVLSVVGWRLARGAPLPVHVIVVGDASASDNRRCVEIVGLVAEARRRLGDHPKSSLLVLMTGSAASAHEPEVLELQKVPRVGGPVLEGAARKKADVDSFFADVRRRCEAWATADVSPLFLALRRGVEQLRVTGTDSTARRTLLAAVDLQENATKEIARALAQPYRSLLPRLPEQIHNGGIEVLICGFTSTVGLTNDANGLSRSFTTARSPDHASRIREVWSALFSDTTHVVFQPLCPALPDGGGQ